MTDKPLTLESLAERVKRIEDETIAVLTELHAAALALTANVDGSARMLESSERMIKKVDRQLDELYRLKILPRP